MILALSHAFTGPLLSVLDRDGVGFHLRGAFSSGKTKILRAATSVWGAPSFMQSWRSTDNGLESVAAACSHSLLALD
jgi:putative DNA primase/helicase